jgi:hypothetical protein
MTAPAARLDPAARHWLLFVHQLPSNPSNLRVRTWRRLQHLGAIPIKQAVYVLPDTPTAREDFEWLKAEVKAAGGDASVFEADNVDAWSDDALVEEFRRTRQEAYAALARDVERMLKRSNSARRPRRGRAPAIRRHLVILRERLIAIEAVDFFGSAGRDRVMTLLKQLEEQTSETRQPAVSSKPATGAGNPAIYQGRMWLTRPRPGVDRMASAWLIRRFIDPQARFGFAADRDTAPRDALPFDMFGVEFTHRDDHCTFETLCDTFGINEAAVMRIAAVVHDLDLKDAKFGAPEAPSVGTIIDGLQLAYADDEALLAQGIVLFEALYRAADRAARPAGPRVVAAKRQGRHRQRRK